ncbi:hypothetical protein KC336_g16944 [Hortaea werneckii]|nr:hypothetical protein KC336_g16944 [Hortaea werneckii]
MGKGKPRGLLAARKLRNHRRDGKWADLHYKKRLLGTAFKSSPFGVCIIAQPLPPRLGEDFGQPYATRDAEKKMQECK